MFSLIEAENEFLVQPDDLSIPRPGLWPSEASVEYIEDGQRIVEGSCMRAMVYRNLEYPSGCNDPLLNMKGKMGTSCEKTNIETHKRMGLWVANNVKFFLPAYAVSGELDEVIKNPNTGRLIGLEMKSYYGHYANQHIRGAKRPPTPGKPKPGHFLQAVVYAHNFADKLEEYRIVYTERGDGYRVEFEVGTYPETEKGKKKNRPFWKQIEGPYWNYYSDDIIAAPFFYEDILARYAQALKHIKARQIPPRDFEEEWNDERIEWMFSHNRLGKTKYEDWKKRKKRPGDWQCKNIYCRYYEQCNKDS